MDRAYDLIRKDCGLPWWEQMGLTVCAAVMETRSANVPGTGCPKHSPRRRQKARERSARSVSLAPGAQRRRKGPCISAWQGRHGEADSPSGLWVSFPEHPLELGDEGGELEGLLDVARHPHVGKLGLDLRFGLSREEEDANPGVDIPDGLKHLQARHPRQHQIQEHHLDLLRVPSEEGHPSGPVGGGQDREAVALQDVAEDLAHELVIIDDQDEPATASPSPVEIPLPPLSGGRPSTCGKAAPTFHLTPG
jgi:hypothetical protein